MDDVCMDVNQQETEQNEVYAIDATLSTLSTGLHKSRSLPQACYGQTSNSSASSSSTLVHFPLSTEEAQQAADIRIVFARIQGDSKI